MIPVSVARDIAEEHGQGIVILVSYEPATNTTHLVTYGVTAEQKEAAAKAADDISEVLNLDEPREVFEDFRREGERAVSFDELLRACKASAHAFDSLLAVREGLTDEFLVDLRNAANEAVRKAESLEDGKS